jgi:hypothetical protein
MLLVLRRSRRCLGRRKRNSGPPAHRNRATKETSSVIRLPTEPLGEASGLLARCLRANPNFLELFADERV